MATWLLCIVLGYFLLLLAVAYRTSRHSDNDTFFIGNRSSNWMLVAFGMIGTSLSGVTFISVPGTVGDFAAAAAPNIGAAAGFKGFQYFQVVIGYFLGYFAIAFVLLPLYYRLGLTSIYHYLMHRLGLSAYRTGTLFFILSRTVGATARLYLVINVLQVFVLDALGIPFALTAVVILGMILLYTFRGGVKTIVWTDTLQTTFMLLGLLVCGTFVLHHLHMGPAAAWTVMKDRGLTHLFNTDPRSSSWFVKQILGGAFIAIAMTGLDQEMMQKNISVRTLRDSQKNMVTFTFITVLVNLLFLVLGGLLYLYAVDKGAVYSGKTLLLGGRNIIGDDLFPTATLRFFPLSIMLIFVVALISALFPSADGALTALTSSFCIDLLGIKERHDWDETRKKRVRLTVHVTFAVIFLACILGFKWIDNKSTINVILDLAGYTYGPLLGLFVFGIFTRRSLRRPGWVPVVCILSPLVCYVLSHGLTGGYKIGIELLILNGLLTFLGLLTISQRGVKTAPEGEF